MNIDEEYLLTSAQLAQQFSACLWNYKTLNVQRHYKNGGTISPKCLEFVGQDYLLAAELGKPLLHVWPLNSQETAKNLRLILPEPATCLAVCPKNVFLAVGISSKIYVWEMSSGKLLSVQQKHYQPVTCIKFSSDGEFLLAGGQDGYLVAYKVADIVALSTNFLAQSNIGQVEPVYVKSDHSMPIRDIHIGHFGRKSRFATVSYDQSCMIYDLIRGDPILKIVNIKPLTAVVFDAPCWQVFLGSDNGVIKQFDLKNPPRTITYHADDTNEIMFVGHKNKVVSLAINISNTYLASGGEDCFVFIWEIKSRQIMKSVEHKSPITNVKFVLGFNQFHAETFKPTVVMKNLERTIVASTDFAISRLQKDDIELSDEENFSEGNTSHEDLIAENRKLHIINKQLYSTALEISQKYSNKS